jgi:hypothetical protein
MLADICIGELRARVDAVEIRVQERTLLYDTACRIREMALAYESDGRLFIEKGDRVNGLASAAYGLGWLDAGYCLGVISCIGKRAIDLFTAITIPSEQSGFLSEKVERYDQLLDLALRSLEIAPESGTPLHTGAERFLSTAEVFHQYGRLFIANDGFSPALFCFSYGYAWLDTGIQAGLFRVKGTRDIFTL